MDIVEYYTHISIRFVLFVGPPSRPYDTDRLAVPSVRLRLHTVGKRVFPVAS